MEEHEEFLKMQMEEGKKNEDLVFDGQKVSGVQMYSGGPGNDKSGGY